MPSLQSYTTVQDLYIAYYQRPGDPSGLKFWAQMLEAPGTTLEQVEAAFGNAPESQALYGPINSSTISTVIDSMYMAMFNRLPDAAGKQFYIDGFNAGTFTPTSIAYNILIGATGADAVAIDNKELVANDFSQTVDGRTFADPNFGNGPNFNATYEGDADAVAARAGLATVTSDPTTVPNHSQIIGFIQTEIANPGDPILNTVPGATLNLTTGLDSIQVPPGGATDLVKGFFDNTAGSTLTPADSISGNNNTIFKLVTSGSWGGIDAPYFDMAGVNQMQVAYGGGGGANLVMHGATYGDLGSVSLSGADGFYLDVEDLELQGKFDISVAGGTQGEVYASGSLDGLVFEASAWNDTTTTSTSSVSLSTAAITAAMGNDAYGYAYLAQTKSGSAASVAVGDLAIGNIGLTIGQSGSFSVTVTNSAYNSGTGAAKVGNLTVGPITADIADSGYASIYFDNYAYANNGAATVGNLAIGDVTVNLGASASLDYLEATNEAVSHNGAATAGNLTLGNVMVQGAGDNYETVYLYNEAFAYTAGNATVGNVTIGNIDMATASTDGYVTFEVENYAYAAKGTATAGNVAVGNVHMAVGDSADAYFSISNEAYASAGGKATAGNVTLGNIDLSAGNNGDASAYVSNYAYAAGAAASVGNITIGDANVSVGVDGYARIEVSNWASGAASAAADVAGNLKIGNVNMYGSANADINFSVSNWSENGNAGALTIGNVMMRVENSGSLSFSVQDYAHGNVGDVKIGNLNLSAGSNATIDYFNLSVSASHGDVSSFAIGNVSIATEGVQADVTSTGVYVYAHDDIGNVSIGNVSINMAKSASFEQSWTIEADTGSIGNITEGNISLVAATNAYVSLDQYFSADDQIGNVTVGNITLTAQKGADALLYHEVYNNDDIGTVTYGDISLTANGANAYAYGFLSVENDDSHDIGAITAGNVSLLAKGSGADASLTLSFTSADTIGPVKVGNITLEMQNTKTGTATAYNDLYIYDEGGTSDLTLGDIKITGNTGVTALWATTAKVAADFYISSDDGISIGNISVVGGNKIGAVSMDNFADLKALLDLHAGASGITVGNIDYSGYKAAAIIDASTWKGAAAITAAQKDTVIYDNKTKNVMTLGAGADQVHITLANSGKLEATCDQIVGFAKGTDLMYLNLAGTDFAYSAATRTFDQFITAASNAMASDGVDIFSQKIGANSFIAFDKDANGTLDFVVEVVGVQIDTDTSFVFAP
jgi:hypothetical protein